MVSRNKTVETSWESDQVSPIVAGSETDSEDFTSDVESFALVSSSEEETYVFVILRNSPFEPKLNPVGAMDEDLNHESELLEEDEDSDNGEDCEFESPESNFINDAVKISRERLAHLDNDSQNIIETALRGRSIVATSVDDLRSGAFLIKHHLELPDTNPMYHFATRMDPLHIDIVCKEPENAGSRHHHDPFRSSSYCKRVVIRASVFNTVCRTRR